MRTAAVVFIAVGCMVGQINLGSSPNANNPKQTRVTSRTLTGLVLDKSDQPIVGAVVYLKNTKTLTVKSFFSQPDGSYRFPELPLNINFDVYAEKDGKRSAVKTLSEFDDRANPKINLKIDMSK
jgi:hypothetical protein